MLVLHGIYSIARGVTEHRKGSERFEAKARVGAENDSEIRKKKAWVDIRIVDPKESGQVACEATHTVQEEESASSVGGGRGKGFYRLSRVGSKGGIS